MTILAADKFGPNRNLLITLRKLGYFNHSGITMDVTWGRGKWWPTARQDPDNAKAWGDTYSRFIRHDLYTLDGVSYLALPEPDASVTMIAFDPPYISPGGRASSTIGDFNERYGIDKVARTPDLLDAEVARALRELMRVVEPGGIILHKTANYITSGQLHLSTVDAINSGTSIGLKVAEMLTHVGNVRAQPAGRTVRHARQNSSTMIVWRKPGRRPKRSRPIPVDWPTDDAERPEINI